MGKSELSLDADEFSIIRQFFTHPPQHASSGVLLGVGDDCALLQPALDTRLAVTMDTLVSGVHFFEGTDAERLGHKALAVNLSDLAAMGATPRWVMLSLTLPEPDVVWIADFMKGFMALAGQHQLSLVGGDTTRGPLSITVQAMGEVPVAIVGMRRDRAKVGDLICLSGGIGLAGLALYHLLQGQTSIESSVIDALEKPMPQLATSLAIREWANACIDLSDGLAQDLGHILTASGVGASLIWEALPLAECVLDHCQQKDDPWMPLMAGDDYQLCFTVSPEHRDALVARLASENLPCHIIGHVEDRSGLRLNVAGQTYELPLRGFRHFS